MLLNRCTEGGPSVAKSLGRDAAKGRSDAAISSKASDWLSSNAAISANAWLSRGSSGFHSLV